MPLRIKELEEVTFRVLDGENLLFVNQVELQSYLGSAFQLRKKYLDLVVNLWRL